MFFLFSTIFLIRNNLPFSKEHGNRKIAFTLANQKHMHQGICKIKALWNFERILFNFSKHIILTTVI